MIGVLAAASGAPDSARGMNESMVATTKRLVALNQRYINALEAALRSEQASDVLRVRDRYNQVAGEVDKAIAEVGRWDPYSVEGAEEFKSAVTRFCLGQKRMLEGHHQAMLEALENKGLTKVARVHQIQEALGHAAARGQQDLADLQAAQQQFARMHGGKPQRAYHH
jgi:hypothetical protein